MAGEHLAWIAIFALAWAIPILLWAWRKREQSLLRNAWLVGGLAGGLDVIVEATGTMNALWTYEKSAFFLFGHVPIELPLMFFGAGVMFAGLHHALVRSTWDLALAHVQVLLVVLGLIVYAYWIAAGVDITMLIVTVPLGLWGYEQLQDARIRSLGLLTAAGVGLLDYFLEAWIVGAGNYGYTSGFKPETPLTYAMLILMLFGLLERRRQGSAVPSEAIRDES